jgi:hypothetical protein
MVWSAKRSAYRFSACLPLFMSLVVLSSCRVLMVDGDHRVGLFAAKDIAEGEELFYNYRWAEPGSETCVALTSPIHRVLCCCFCLLCCSMLSLSRLAAQLQLGHIGMYVGKAHAQHSNADGCTAGADMIRCLLVLHFLKQVCSMVC